MHDAPNSSGLGTDAASAGSAATVGEFLCDALHDSSNSLGMDADAFLAGAFRLHDFEGHSHAAGVLGDTGSAFSTICLIRDSCNNSFHPIHACAHSCLDRCGVGVWGRGVGVACPLSCLSVGVDDDEDVASMGGSNSLIQCSVCHANACAGSDALHNSRQVRGHCHRGGTKCTSTGSGTKVWLSDEIRSSLSHQKSESLHVETWAGSHESPLQEGFQVRDFLARCASVSVPLCCSDLTSVLPGPGSEIRKQLGWMQLEETGRSGVWFFRGALSGEDLFSSLAVSGGWVKKGSYHTAWSVPGDSSCTCSYAYGHGPAIGPHTGQRCWVLLSCLWRTIAPLMRPWCAEGEVPTAANLNLYRGGNSRVNWHSDDEPLFGRSGVHKLIVSVSFGASVLFKWKGKSCLDSVERSCWLGHGDILVMDVSSLYKSWSGTCADECYVPLD